MDIALIAHDGKKASMVSFVMKRLDFFNRKDVNIIATGTTGEMIHHAGINKVEPLLSGPLGGDAQIAALAANGKIDGVVFFRDPLGKHPHEVDIAMLMRICDVYNVPLATNYKSGHILIKYFKNK